MNGQYIYNPPPPPPPQSRNNSGSQSRRGGGPVRSTPQQRPGQQGRSRPQPYDTPISRSNPNNTTSALQTAPIAASVPSSQPDQNRTVIIPGTSISLNTKEEIEAWIQERKKKWPTTARVEAKQAAAAAERAQRESERGNSSSGQGDTNSNSTKKPQMVCKFYKRNKKCLNGDKCRFSHQLADDPNSASTPGKGSFSNKRYTLYEAPTKMPLFKMLVRNDLDLENKPVLEFIEYLALNNKI